MWRNWNPYILLVECKMVQLLWKSAWHFLKKLSLELLHDPEMSLLGTYPRETKTCSLVHECSCTQMFLVALFITAKK